MNRTLAAALLIVLPYAAGRGLPPPAPPPPRFVPVNAGIHVVALWPGADSSVARPVVADGASAGGATLLSKTASAASVAPDGTLHYSIAVTNTTAVTQTFRITDTLPAGLSYIANTATGGFVYNAAATNLVSTTTLPAFQVIIPTGAPPYTEFFTNTLAANICQTYFAECDDSAITIGFSGFSFRYLGVDYTTVTLDSNGFILPGSPGPHDLDTDALNQQMPDSAPPNNVIAPFWADLDLRGKNGDHTGRGDWLYADLHDSGSQADYLVVEWHDAQKKGDPGTSYSFQVWIQRNAEHITFAYDHLTGDTSSATIGFENSDGSLGHSYLVNGVPAGHVPGSGGVLQPDYASAIALLGFDVRAQHDLQGCSTITNTVILSNAPGTIITSTAATTNVFAPCQFLPLISH